MSRNPSVARRILGVVFFAIVIGFFLWAGSKPRELGASRRYQEAEQELRQSTTRSKERQDAQLVGQLLRENLGERRFAFSTVVLASSGHRVLPLDPSLDSHRRVLEALDIALEEAKRELSAEDSPLRALRRINEGSRFFEDRLKEKLEAHPSLTCEVPPNREGRPQRSGYPDLKLTDQASGDVFYLDPKLVEETSWESSFRSFYFEPKKRTMKINEDAVHLLVGIGHDGNDGAWAFRESKVVDLAGLKLRLKAEFQASNADLYPEGER